MYEHVSLNANEYVPLEKTKKQNEKNMKTGRSVPQMCTCYGRPFIVFRSSQIPMISRMSEVDGSLDF